MIFFQITIEVFCVIVRADVPVHEEPSVGSILRILIPVFGKKSHEAIHTDTAAERFLFSHIKSHLQAAWHAIGELLGALRVFEPYLVTVIKGHSA